MKNAVVLLSGGLDSTTVLAIAKSQGYQIYALSFDYGQRLRVELDCARRIAKEYGAKEHLVFQLDLRSIGGSSLTSDSDMRKHDNPLIKPTDKVIPNTYVPARNTIMLSIALGFAETRQAWDIFLGANTVDYSYYPDCRPEYLEAFEHMANLSTKAGVEGQRTRIHAPLLHLSKAEIIQKGTELLVDYGLTHTCYDPVGDLACGVCDSCVFRHLGFVEAGVPDPTRYVQR